MRSFKHIMTMLTFSVTLYAQPFKVTFDAQCRANVVDTANGNKVIISPALHAPWVSTVLPGMPTVNAPDLDSIIYPDGYDLIFNFNNTTGDTASLGSIYLDGIRFDSIITKRLTSYFNGGGKADSINHHNTWYFGGGAAYPGTMYSPCEVISNEDYSIGITFQYPAMEYRHYTFFRVETSSNIGGLHWGLLLGLNTNQMGIHTTEGDLLPGEKRSYKMTVRIMRKAETCKHWLELLDPYKKYFHNMYGGVTYERDPRPIAGVMNFMDGCISESNPYGFVPTTLYDNPVDSGFKSLVKYINDTVYNAHGYKRIMVWSPTGLSKTNNLNYPNKFTSHWLEGDTNLYPHSYGHKMGDATEHFSSLATADRKLGFWWGRSVEVMTEWDSKNWSPLDPDDTAMVNHSFREIDLAVQAGATEIGLDQFALHKFWHLYKWAKIMRARYPQLHFSQEQATSDYLNAVIPFYYYTDRLPSQHYIADYLLPGNEVWGQISNAWDPTGTYWKKEFKRLSENGIVPLDISTYKLDKDYTAAEGRHLLPLPVLGADNSIMPDDSLVLNAAHAGATKYLWSNGDTTASIKANTPGQYWVKTTSVGGCIKYDTIVISHIKDTIPPTVPINLKETEVGQTHINIAWSPSHDAFGVTGYDIYVNNVKIFTVTDTFYNIHGLNPAQKHTIYVTAKDAAGNISNSSNKIIVVTHPISLDENSRQIRVYPNPASELLNISGINETFVVEIFNSGGTLVLERNSEKHISLSGIPSGFYMVRIKDQDKVQAFKIEVIR